MVSKHSLSKVFIYLFLGLVISWTIPNGVFAQQSNQGVDLTVSPTVIELSDVPGTTMQSHFRIRNNLDTPVNLQLSISKLTANGDYENLKPADVQRGDESLQWLSFDTASISARPKEWSEVKLTLAIPKTAAFGYYYAIHIKQIPPKNAPLNTAAKLIGEVIIPVLLEVQSNGTVAEAQIVDFKPASFINEYLPVDFITKVKNTGNIHLKPRGNIFISLGGEKDSGVLNVNELAGSILPTTTRTFHTNWNDGFLVMEPVVLDGNQKRDNRGQPVTQLTAYWDKISHFRIGKYSANVLLVYDNGKRDIALEAKTTFWVFPYRIIGGTILGIIILIFGIRFLLQLYIKKQINKYQRKQ